MRFRRSKNSNRRIKLSEENREASSKYISVRFYDPDMWFDEIILLDPSDFYRFIVFFSLETNVICGIYVDFGIVSVIYRNDNSYLERKKNTQ